MPKILYNNTYGGFRISDVVKNNFELLTGIKIDSYREDKYRYHPELIKLVEKFGEKASTSRSWIKIKEFPDYISPSWIEIEEYDGMESVYVDFGKAYEEIAEQYYGNHPTLGIKIDEITDILRKYNKE